MCYVLVFSFVLKLKICQHFFTTILWIKECVDEIRVELTNELVYLYYVSWQDLIGLFVWQFPPMMISQTCTEYEKKKKTYSDGWKLIFLLTLNLPNFLNGIIHLSVLELSSLILGISKWKLESWSANIIEPALIYRLPGCILMAKANHFSSSRIRVNYEKSLKLILQMLFFCGGKDSLEFRVGI